MARYAQDKIEEVRTRADIVEVIGAHVRLRRSGRNYSGLCPFHNEKTPSFTVNAERGFFHCFGCGVGGSVFDFVMRIEALSFPEALQSLARRYGVALPPPQSSGGESAGTRDALFLANQTAAEFFSYVLWKTDGGAAARDYLKARGISAEIARECLLGFAPNRPANLAAALQKRKLADEGLRVGLLKADQRGAPYDMFRARLMFPIRDAQGRVIAFGGRVLDERLPKYINSPESPLYTKARAVYGLYEARQTIAKGDRAIIVEGYIDAIALWQAGFKETVASLGTALTADQLRLLARYTRNLIACFDGDGAGQKASLRALEVFLEAGILGKGAFIPSGFDPDSLVRQRGAQALTEILERAELLVDYFLKSQASAASGSTDDKARAAERVAQLLARIGNAFEFDLLASKAAAMLGISESLLRAQARKTSATKRVTIRPDPIAKNRTLPDAKAQAEFGLLAIALRWPELRAAIAPAIPGNQQTGVPVWLARVCAADRDDSALEIAVMAEMNEDERGRLSGLIVGDLLQDEAKAGALVADYLNALAHAEQRDKVAELRRTARQGQADDAAAAAQAVIALRRGSR